MRPVLVVVFLMAAFTLPACSDDGSNGSGGGVDATPERLNGSESQAFEQSDIDRANSASAKVQAYCAGAVSEAQRVGCLSHVDESDVP
jgi:hypothetical protein